MISVEVFLTFKQIVKRHVLKCMHWNHLSQRLHLRMMTCTIWNALMCLFTICLKVKNTSTDIKIKFKKIWFYSSLLGRNKKTNCYWYRTWNPRRSIDWIRNCIFLFLFISLISIYINVSKIYNIKIFSSKFSPCNFSFEISNNS